MKVLGIYGSPRKGGNSDLLLDEALQAAAEAGAEVTKVYCRKLKMDGCLNCGGCDKTGECVLKDDMQTVYPLMDEADAIILSVPMFFYGAPAQAKALVDRCQARWSRRMLTKTREERKHFDHGKGYMIGVGATKGENLFQGTELMAKYFYDALDMSYEGGLMLRGLEGKGAVSEHPETLEQARELGRRVVAQA
jgi:multimeric flavodoxin WrbA